MGLWINSFCRLRVAVGCGCGAGGVAHQGRAVAELCRALEEVGGLQKPPCGGLEGGVGKAECCTWGERCQPASEVLRQHSGLLRNVG